IPLARYGTAAEVAKVTRWLAGDEAAYISGAVIPLGRVPDAHACSRAGCPRTATFAIEWRNPRIHAEDRRKTWLACGEHREFLREFLLARGFPLEVKPLYKVDRGAER
ncbi:hypothetical protein, partial [Rathayibacter sp. AY1D4]|uniref:hypothetical protein n=1 Tax=Rathayibacter sp. AY1D4 TaxID=2080545 RepID=UPI0028006E66